MCNVCDMPNEVPMDYFAGVDAGGRRLDEAHRPELGQGSVEYVAPQEYMVRPKIPVFMLAELIATNWPCSLHGPALLVPGFCPKATCRASRHGLGISNVAVACVMHLWLVQTSAIFLFSIVMFLGRGQLRTSLVDVQCRGVHCILQGQL